VVVRIAAEPRERFADVLAAADAVLAARVPVG
jgi:hypothetical protein